MFLKSLGHLHAVDSEKGGWYKMAASGILKVKVADIHFNNLGNSNFFLFPPRAEKREENKKLSHKFL